MVNQEDLSEPNGSVKYPLQHPPHTKTDISRGRKALLRISARAFEERKRKKSSPPLANIDTIHNANTTESKKSSFDSRTSYTNNSKHILSLKEVKAVRKARKIWLA